MPEPDALSDVRLLIADVDPADQLLDDAQLAQLLALEDDDPWRAAGAALRVIATSEVLVQKRIRLLDLQTDGPAVAAELRALAESYEQRADQGDGVTIAEIAVGPFGRRQRMANELRRAMYGTDDD